MCVEQTEMEANDMLRRPLKGEVERRGLVGDMYIFEPVWFREYPEYF